MGNSWKTMTLLSTLAALVIIVYSAEEDFEPDYRDVRPRRYDTATTNYEQPWRLLDMEPIATRTTQPDWPVTSQEDPPKRRRPGRKRKRRPPPPTSEEDLISQERNVYQEEYRPYQNEKFNPQPSIIRRRRKQFDVRQSELPNTWTHEIVDVDRPFLRKRGQKRKRPIVEDTTELSLFNGYRPNDNTDEDIDNSYVQPTESTIYEANHNYDNNKEIDLKNEETLNKSDLHNRNPNKYNIYEAENYNTEYIAAGNDDNSNNKKDDDKSLSEFSLEIQPTPDDISTSHEKVNEKAISTLNEVEKAKSNETLDPQALKQILKKSNGRSLSEILQQHNLSLVDLLHGKEKAVSILLEDSSQNDSVVLKDQLNIYSKGENYGQTTENLKLSKRRNRLKNRIVEPKPKASVRNTVIIKNISEDHIETNNQKYDIPDSISEHTTTMSSVYIEAEQLNSSKLLSEHLTNIPQNTELTETTTKSFIRRRFPVGVHRKLRIRPLNTTSYKSQLNRDLMALTSRRYQVNRNISRSREWKDVMPTQVKMTRKDENISIKEKEVTNNPPTTTFTPQEDIATEQSLEDANLSTLTSIAELSPSTTSDQTDSISTEPTLTMTLIDFTTTENIPSTTTTTSTTSTTTTTTTTTEMPVEKSVSRPVKASDLRRQAFNNRLKRKRLKQKTTTTEPTQEYAMKDIFGMANLVSASEFIAKVLPRTTNSDEEQDFTTLEDFITTEIPLKSQTRLKSVKLSKNKYSTTPVTLEPVQDMEMAKIEIEEILNDTLTSARLSKILMERNMTLNELVEHRERGSSHIHLADIFHNASREPNPPEPFLSKSLIEPISKETYPLRALLEANLHDPTAKATPMEANSTYLNNINIPVVMDFGNNVNENGENMGIMSLFDNFTKITQMDQHLNISKGQTMEINSQPPEVDSNHKYGTSRESRTLNTDKDLVSWKEIIAIMQRTRNNNTNEIVELTTKDITPVENVKKISVDDIDGDDDRLIMINDLHHLDDIKSKAVSTSQENHEYQLHEKPESPQVHGVLNKTSDSAKSVTVATASIIGLAMVLFLLTYVAFRWKQQRSMFQEKPTLRRDRIPTPVFENRKSHKINSSTRSKSPMISSSNIYSIDTLETRNGNESPEYMWDSLRKPFQ